MAILVRERELREEVARLTRENSRLGGLRAAVESVIAAATRPHPKDATVTICEVCDVAAAGIEHERGCYVGVLAMALKRAAPASDQPATPQPAPDVQTALADALERALEEGDHPRDCPFRHDEADCECWRSVVRAALLLAGRNP